ncbi:MAG: hypothetical protein RBT70_08705 [Alphaproteobacteria bacterium]|nr:hypothetical protein [Alphaproteobacteria bacterium]
MTNEVTTLQGQSLTANPFGSAAPAAVPSGGMGNALMTAETQRAIAEIQAASIMALHNPRNPQVAVDRILNECQRPTLAEVAIYSFPRGGQNVTGPSIRLAEVIKRHWQHIRSGWRCLERSKGRSLIEAYAYDIQNNVGENRTFEVHHVRDTRQGRKPLTDERDIYELEANQAARRVRACILALIDGDVIEAALDQCTRTLEAKADTTPEGIKRMLDAFKPFKVNQAMIEARIGRNLSAITAAQMVALKNILNGMKDGMSTREHWFDVTLFVGDTKEPQGSEEKKSSAANAALKDKIKASPVTAQQQKDDKAEDDAQASASAKDIANALANAKTADELDEIWNNNAQVLDTIKQSSQKAYDDLDKAYLQKHDALSNKTNTSGNKLI